MNQSKMLRVGTPNAQIIIGPCVRIGEWLIPLDEYKDWILIEDHRILGKPKD